MTSQGFDWKGMNVKMTPIGDMPGVADYQLNTSMFTENELYRRRGMAQANLDKRSGPVIGLGVVYTPNGPVVIQQTAGALGGFEPGLVLPRWKDAILIPPIGFPLTCTLWATYNDASVSGVSNGYALPASACAGTIRFTSLEDPNNRSGIDYGYSITAFADGIPILASGCLVNAGVAAAIPENTLVVGYTVVAACAGGTLFGSWTLSMTTP